MKKQPLMRWEYPLRDETKDEDWDTLSKLDRDAITQELDMRSRDGHLEIVSRSVIKENDLLEFLSACIKHARAVGESEELMFKLYRLMDKWDEIGEDINGLLSLK